MEIISVDYPALPFGVFPEIRNRHDITDFIVHHSAGPADQTPLEIDAFERNRPDGPDIFIPYEYLAYSDGRVYAGRPVSWTSAASYGRNRESIAVCCVGNYENDEPSQALIDAVVALRIYVQRYLPTLCRTYGHGDIAPMFYPQDQGSYATACPGKYLRAKLPEIRDRVRQALVH